MQKYNQSKGFNFGLDILTESRHMHGFLRAKNYQHQPACIRMPHIAYIPKIGCFATPQCNTTNTIKISVAHSSIAEGVKQVTS